MAADDKAKLKILLEHWIVHNKEHGEEFREWAGKMRSLGESGVGEKMLAAAQEMDRASEMLSRALGELEGSH
ncbi:MAG: hypothetical protein U1B77_02765 [Dehalococcoidales bacterium]|nr:hypothetical protein [Dehalococcoidales bacterium]